MYATIDMARRTQYAAGTSPARIAMGLSNAVRRIQDVMRKDPGVDGDAQRISQVSWLLFLKVFERYETELASTKRRHTLPPELRWSFWTQHHRDMDGSALIEFVEHTLLPGLKAIQGKGQAVSLVRSAFQSVHNHMRSGRLLRDVIGLLDEEIDLGWNRDRHLIGDMYEQLLSDLQGAGNAGEFYTPRALTDFAVSAVAPQPGERVLDFACGVGGFLISSINTMTKGLEWGTEDFRRATAGVTGVEKKALPHFLCITNLLLHGIDRPNAVTLGNLLEKPLRTFAAEDKYDVIITNPPFGGAEEDRVHGNFPDGFRSRETADLFVLLMIELLREGGRAAIILPDGFLFGSGVKMRIRRLLMDTCDLHTIVRIPKGAFSPYTGISTNILFVHRRQASGHIWFYEHPYPSGQKSYSKTKPILLEEFQQERQWWTNRTETPFAWSVPMADIRAREFNLDIRNPYRARELQKNPSHKLRELKTRQQQLLELRGNVRDALVPHLGDKNSLLMAQHIELLTESGNAIKRLRDLVLAFAMSGRFCLPRRTGNRHSQTRVTQKSLGLIDCDSGVDERRAPAGWKYARMHEIADVVGGGTPRTSDPSNFASTGGVPWVTPADLNGLAGKYVSHGQRNLSETGLRESSARLLPRGAVLFSTRAPIGYVAMAAQPLATNQGFKSLVPHDPAMNEFLYYYMLHARYAIEANASGTTFKEVPARAMRDLVIPVPPREEQAEIVKVLDELYDLLNQLEQLVAYVTSLREAAAENMVAYFAFDHSDAAVVAHPRA